jgi:hypothetical protein
MIAPCANTKNRTFILSIASAAAVLPGCGDSSESNATTDAADMPQIVGTTGQMVVPPRDGSPDQGVVTTGDDAAPPDDATVPPGDAGEPDAPRIIIGVVPLPNDAGDARSFPGVMIMPSDGSANG